MGNILVTLGDVYKESESHCLLDGSRALADFLLHYDKDKFLILDIDILGDHLDCPKGVLDESNFMTRTDLEFGN